MSGQRAGDPAIAQRFAGPLPVPTSAVYSRIDGIVAWRCCINDTETPTPAAPAENIEVRSTHLGLGHHPAVLWAVADRLAQAEGRVGALRAARRPALDVPGAQDGAEQQDEGDTP